MSGVRSISLRAAQTHNLKSVDLDLLPGQVVALTGPSGAGKSSLALDTLYAEGQRRFVESFSPYARQFLERLERPPVERLEPVAAAVAVDRRAPIKSSRSTLATLTDLEPYLSALFAAEGVPVCPDCGRQAEELGPGEVAARLCAAFSNSRAIVAFPLADGQSLAAARPQLLVDGFRRILVGSVVHDLEDEATMELAAGPGVAVVADRVVLGEREAGRLQEALELCVKRRGRAEIVVQPGRELLADSALGRRLSYAPGLRCPQCQRGFAAPHARLFSYNSPLGACPSCRGFGRVIDIDWDKVIPDPSRSLRGGAIRPWNGRSSEWERAALIEFARRHRVPLDAPWQSLTAKQQALVLEGEGTWDDGKYPGVRAWFRFLESRTYKMHVRVLLSRYRAYVPCGACGGARWNSEALRYKVAGRNLAEWHTLTVEEALRSSEALAPRAPQGRHVREALRSRLAYLHTVGLGYLQLDRPARTLSGGEAQRASLTTALGAGLTGTLFVLDEPSVGLHKSDVPRLGEAMQALAAAGNTVLLIGHEESLLRRSDRAIELGPGAGPDGGQVLFDGEPEKLLLRTDLPTGRAHAASRAAPRTPRKGKHAIKLRGVRANNLRDLDVDIPLGVLCAVTGPSGSGKSTLAEEVLYRAVARLCRPGECDVERPGAYRSLEGAERLRQAVLVDQSPLGRTARGNAATYTKAWDRLRARFASEPEAARRGLSAAHFSFNLRVGRCPACAGEGYETVEMQFLADVSYRCPLCQGQRFQPEVLAVRCEGKNAAEVLGLTVSQALACFSPPTAPDPALHRALMPLMRVGLGYLPLGQPLSTLSGGEAQRLKLARALAQPAKGTLFIIDEPSAGLHPEDLTNVLGSLELLVEEGASVVVVEHDLKVIAAADWVIDLGPGGGPQGGRLMAVGTPAEVAATETRTGQALRQQLEPSAAPAVTAAARPAARSDPGIVVEQAREHNLKGVSCRIPHGTLSVMTGPSGSGKSSLAFDIVYAEGQRRFMETLSPYARQFLPAPPRPDVDRVDGVPPSIALEQRTARPGANSTVATVTEVAHYLRLLYAKVGTPHCPKCEAKVEALSEQELLERLRSLSGSQDEHTLYAPAVRGRKGVYLDLFTAALRAGVVRARIDGQLKYIDPPPSLSRTREHSIDLVVWNGSLRQLDAATLSRGLGWGGGSVCVGRGAPAATPANEQVFSTARACPTCGIGIPELDPRWFSFNTQQGQCERCEGRGLLDEEKGERRCPACRGTRLAPIPRRVRLCGLTYSEFCGRPVSDALSTARSMTWEGTRALIAQAPHAELLRRLAFIEEIGLGYLQLDRPAATLSGGEMQRLRLSAQLGSGLTGALYVLDEPTIGLHPRDTVRLLRNLRALVENGCTVLCVEHDEETIRAADYLIDLGPGGGAHGGRIVAAGSIATVLADPHSPTAAALRLGPLSPEQALHPSTSWLLDGPSGTIVLRDACAHNLKHVDLRIPVGKLCVIAGPSGSGKSTLVQKTFYPALRCALGLVAESGPPLAHGRLEGAHHVKRAMAVDQSPIGRTPRSVPATFLGVWDDIRRLYASLPEAKVRGFSAQRFSFNTASGGRCSVCEGQGVLVSEMSFLPDVVTPCEACGGSRFEPATLEVRYRGLDIGAVLRLSAEEAAEFFSHHPRIARPLRTLCDLGVGYVELGQGSHTLSGGEAQRLKLADELTAGSKHEPTLYVLDEPTTGLHLLDVRRLITVLARLVARGDTLVVIEHHPDVIAAADWIVELGPDAGEAGGKVVFVGTPAELGRADTATGRIMAQRFSRAGAPPHTPAAAASPATPPLLPSPPL